MPSSFLKSAAAPLARRILPSKVRAWVRDLLNARRVHRNPARIALVTEVLPAYAALGGRILWIGCRRYTRGYSTLLERGGGQCWTTDIEPSHARWGAPGRHFTWDLLAIDQLLAPESFDTVLCNGVFGFGVDTRASQLQALQAMHAILKPGGRLLLGWNTDRVEDPLTFDLVLTTFELDDPTGRGARITIPEAGYVYDFLRRKE
jgi:SAM-dependent methyltransferase